MSSSVIIVDYGMGNVDSVKRALEECGGRVEISHAPEKILGATHLVLPGVGAFTAGMANLRAAGLPGVLHEAVLARRIPLLGICLGMQLLAAKGWEGGETAGLSFIPGEVRLLLPREPEERVPHVGWNEVRYEMASPLFQDIPSGKDFYFVHSYHLACEKPENQIAMTSYAGGFAAAVQAANIFGVQFHPEKSQKAGFQLLKNFLAL